MGGLKNFGLLAAGTALWVQGASAQSLRDFQHDSVTDTRASAAITIPLGARGGSSEAKPRFDLTLATQQIGGSQSVTPLRLDTNVQRQALREAKVSLTIEHNPRLLLNDQRVATFGPRLTADEDDQDGGGGLSTGAGIAIGLGILGGAFLWAGLETADELNDLVDED